MAHILLTQPILPRAQALLAQYGEVIVAADTRPETLREAARACDVIVVRAPLPEDIFVAAPRIIGAVRHGAGVDMIPIGAATAGGVLVANAPGVNAASVAEHVVGQMIRMARRSEAMAAQLAGHDASSWARARALADGAGELASRSVGLIGHGHVGRAIAHICASGFGMQVLTHTRSAPASSLHGLLARSDFVVLACPLTAHTRGMIDASALASMRLGAYLINVARGPVVVESALIDAVTRGHLGGAALDVFDTQPLPADHPLWSLSQVLITPHVAGVTEDSMWRMGQIVAQAVAALLAGQVPAHCINPEAATAFAARFTQRPATP